MPSSAIRVPRAHAVPALTRYLCGNVFEGFHESDPFSWVGAWSIWFKSWCLCMIYMINIVMCLYDICMIYIDRDMSVFDLYELDRDVSAWSKWSRSWCVCMISVWSRSWCIRVSVWSKWSRWWCVCMIPVWSRSWCIRDVSCMIYMI